MVSSDPCAEPVGARRATKAIYASHRNLCEDVRRVRKLKPLRTRLRAEIGIDDSASPEEILANILFRVSNVLAPLVSRSSIEGSLMRGEPLSAVLSGPQMTNGVIEQDELKPWKSEISVRSISSVIAATNGVVMAKGIEIRVRGERRRFRLDDEDRVPVPDGRILELEATSTGGATQIELYRGGRRVKPEPDLVARHLVTLRAQQLRSYDLDAERRRYLAFPKGRQRDVGAYYSIQNQFPAIYGINQYGLPADATPERQAVAKQFKGYLLVYDQLLANFFAQLAAVRDLFSVDSPMVKTLGHQLLTMPVDHPPVPNIEPLVSGRAYPEGLVELVEAQGHGLDRRNNALAFLLALHGESLEVGAISAEQAGGEDRLLQARRVLLENIIDCARNRALAVDLSEGTRVQNSAGMLTKPRIALGMESNPPSLGNTLSDLGLDIATEGRRPTIGRRIDRRSEWVDLDFSDELGSEQPGVGSSTGLVGHVIDMSLLLSVDQGGEFRVGSFSDEQSTSIHFRKNGSDSWMKLAQYPTPADAREAVPGLIASLRLAARRCSGLHIVEHNLLSADAQLSTGSQLTDDDAPDQSPFPPTFTITAVLSTLHEITPDYRAFVYDLIRRSTPTHLALTMCFLHPAHMCEFEDLQFNWREAVLDGSRQSRRDSATLLRDFVQQHSDLGSANSD